MPFKLFFDDFEARNALGSHAGVNKFGAVYGMIDCLPPKLKSKLDSIHLISLFYSEDRKDFGNTVVFQRLINELNFLKNTGIFVTIKNRSYDIYFECDFPIGDNMGINSILGLPESFSATKSCRCCTVTKNEQKYMTTEDVLLLRNRNNYQEDLLKKEVKTTGVKEECVFHRIEGFHLTERITYDIMHDFSERVANYCMRNLTYRIVFVDKLPSLEELNKRIEHFSYNEHDKCNIPNTITADYIKKNNVLKLSAADSMNLILNFCLMVGDVIPREYPYWQLYVKLKEILSILLSPKLHRAYGEILQILIEEHHSLYIKLFGELRPTFHNMIHYSRIFYQSGPLVNNWGMRFESKNKQLKDLIESIASSKHLLVSMTERYQLRLCYLHYKGFEDDIVTSARAKIDNDIRVCFPEVIDTSAVESYKFIKVNSQKFSSGEVYLISMSPEEDQLHFGKIHRIYKYNGEFYFFMHYIECVTFNNHVQAYRVNVSDSPNIRMKLKQLPYYSVCTLSQINDSFYVSSRFKI